MSAENRAVFLSYASQDAEAARRICDALRAAGVEVWFDQSELRGGDAWDAKIRKQIKECALFVPIISANTQARREGYFRFEWRLAAQRTQAMAEGTPFLLPVVIDDTPEPRALVPAEFREVQWTRLRGDDQLHAFGARVLALLESGGASAPPFDAESAGSRPPAGSSKPPFRGRRKWPWIAAAGLVAVVLLALVGPWQGAPPVTTPGATGIAQSSQARRLIGNDPRFQRLLAKAPASGAAAAVMPVRAVDRNSIAVLPLANRSDDKATEYFSDGISEELLNVLGKVPGLQVVGWTSALSFKGRDANWNEIREKLGAAYFVDGSVRKDGSRVQIRARLTRTDNGYQMWGDTYEDELKDIFALQDRIARDVAAKLQLKLGAAAARTKTVNPEAHAAVLEGRHFFAPRTYEGFDRAEAAFQRALRIDPDFAEAHAGLGMLWVTRAGYSELDGRAFGDLAARGIAEAKRAIEVDRNLPDGYEALGYAALWAGEFAQAEKHLQTALALNPNSPGVRFNLGLVLSNMGRLDESIAAHERAASLDPLGWMNLQYLARSLTWARRYGEAHELNERAAALRGPEVFIPNRGEKALLEMELGRHREAAEAARYLRKNPDVYPRWQLDSIAVAMLWETGNKQEATDYAAELFKKWPADHYQRGFVLNALDRFDEALPYLERTPAQPVRYLFWDKRWDARRNDPRFLALIAKLGRSEEYKTARETLTRLQQEHSARK